MSDVKERLRVIGAEGEAVGHPALHDLCRDALEEIVRLEEVNAKLLEATANVTRVPLVPHEGKCS